PTIFCRLGYKLRVQIAKHLQSRSKAIRTALNNFNAAARALYSNHVNLIFNDILQHSFVGEFDLLQCAREDIRDKPWASPVNRILVDQYFRYLRAKEEIGYLNIEVNRVLEWMYREDHHYLKRAEEIAGTNPYLAAEIRQRGTYQHIVNDSIRAALWKVANLPGFLGKLWTPPLPSNAPPQGAMVVGAEHKEEIDDEVVDTVDMVMQVMERHN
ncbi:hypothetical protein FRC03_005027, partial [Tulasnella sp. 419]